MRQELGRSATSEMCHRLRHRAPVCLRERPRGAGEVAGDPIDAREPTRLFAVCRPRSSRHGRERNRAAVRHRGDSAPGRRALLARLGELRGPRWSWRAVPAHRGSRRAGNYVHFSSIRAFKGLESPVVILCELEDLDEATHAQQLYVGLSRARNHCVVVGRQRRSRQGRGSSGSRSRSTGRPSHDARLARYCSRQ